MGTTRLVALIALFALVACGAHRPAMSTHPTVYLDEAFTVSESAAIARSFADWTSTGRVTFDVVNVAHAEVLRLGKDPGVNTIDIVRDGGDCPFSDPRPHLATTTPGDAAVICMAGDLLDDFEWNHHGHGWQSAMTHELGHAFLMQHDESGTNSLYPYLDAEQASETLTVEDLKQFDAIWGSQGSQ